MIDNVTPFQFELPRSTPADPPRVAQVILLITGTLHERDTDDLLERCHPLGVFDTMPALCVATNVEELYSTVIVETPLG